MQKIMELEKQIKSLTDFMRSFESAAQLSPQAQTTITKILDKETQLKLATSENRSVNEGGTSTYSVLNPPAYFIKLGNSYIPAYNL